MRESKIISSNFIWCIIRTVRLSQKHVHDTPDRRGCQKGRITLHESYWVHLKNCLAIIWLHTVGVQPLFFIMFSGIRDMKIPV